MRIANISVAEIYPIRPRRKLRQEWVKKLAASIAEIGLQVPISVLEREGPVPCVEGPVRHYELVAGEHRFEACLDLAWKTIPCLVSDLSDVDAALWQIDENFIRAELSTLERDEQFAQRQVLYELRHPETKHGGAPGATGHGKGGKVANLATLPQTPSFVEDTAAKTMYSEREIQRGVHRAEAIDAEVKRVIADDPEIADSGVELDALASMKVEDQKRAVAMKKAGEVKTIREAKKKIHPKGKKKKKPPTLAALTKAWTKAKDTWEKLLTTWGAAAESNRDAFCRKPAVEDWTPAQPWVDWKSRAGS